MFLINVVVFVSAGVPVYIYPTGPTIHHAQQPAGAVPYVFMGGPPPPPPTGMPQMSMPPPGYVLVAANDPRLQASPHPSMAHPQPHSHANAHSHSHSQLQSSVDMSTIHLQHNPSVLSMPMNVGSADSFMFSQAIAASAPVSPLGSRRMSTASIASRPEDLFRDNSMANWQSTTIPPNVQQLQSQLQPQLLRSTGLSMPSAQWPAPLPSSSSKPISSHSLMAESTQFPPTPGFDDAGNTSLEVCDA